MFNQNMTRIPLISKLTGTGNYKWPRSSAEVRDLTWKEFSWLMDGLEIDQPKAIQNTSIRG
ncbi:MAG: IS66 family insertion sequence element accessory protein TnpB [Lachnospiraceae bacterium]|nr:IS66 family insertion sequence element accessory protein TnpB [Lachnospiraceae bacterium]